MRWWRSLPAMREAAVRDAARDLLAALDPVYFARHRLNFEPDFWQADLLRSTSRWTLVLCSRQAGKSVTSALLALYTALHTPNALVLLVAPSLRQAAELFH